MIVVFLIILIMALIIANILVSALRPKKNTEKGFVNPYSSEEYEPEVVSKIEDLHENTALMQGSLTATNKKIELLNQRLLMLEKVVLTLTSEKLGEKISAPAKDNNEETPKGKKKK